MLCRVQTDCGPVLPLENGSVSFTSGLLGTNTLNATATYTCDHGFNLSSFAQRTCSDTSEWFPGAPQCTLGKLVAHIVTAM